MFPMVFFRIFLVMLLLTGLAGAEQRMDYEIKDIVLPESPTGHIRLVALSADKKWDVTFELLHGRCPFIGEIIEGSAPRELEDTTRHHIETFQDKSEGWSVQVRFETIYRVFAPGR
jgi:hypothetical protein